MERLTASTGNHLWICKNYISDNSNNNTKVSVSALPHMHFNVTSRQPPGSRSDGRASCMELLEALTPQATSVMEVSRNHRGSEANDHLDLRPNTCPANMLLSNARQHLQC
uniref:CYTL1 domain-containing protein isoform X2 n=1 Tax=Scatophagus argus TaxID=75038 RepID=UPI001ED832A0|nr:CYTL1 domain-containing protein isoform X2 [Scatophagus argus]